MSDQAIIPALHVGSLTAAAFAPFGTLLCEPQMPPTVERGDITYWHATSDLAGLASSGVTGHLIAHHRDFVLTQIERHNHTPEAFIPLQNSSVLVVAPPGDFEISQMRAFVLEPGCGVLLSKGTWHWAPFPISLTAQFLLVLRRETVEHDIEILDIPTYTVEILA
jgi:ureidoglycolate lyase